MIRKSFYVFLYSILLTSLSAQYFTLSDESLDFGNVLVGGSYTLDLAIFSQADQTFSLSVPTYFTVSDTDFSMSVGEQKTIQITFTPPFAIDVSSYLIIISDLYETAVQLTATGINELSGSISGVLSSDYSPYNVVGPIIVESGSSLILEPGVTLVFNENTSLIVDGTLVAKGRPNELIKFIGHEGNGYKGIIANEGSTLDLSFIYLSDIDLGNADFISNFSDASSFINSNNILSSNIFLNENNFSQDIDDFNILSFQSPTVTFVDSDYIEYFSGYWGNCSVGLNSDSFETTNCYGGSGYGEVSLVSEFFIVEDGSSIDLQTYTSGSNGGARVYLQIFNEDNFSYSESQVYESWNSATENLSLSLSDYVGQKLRIRLWLYNRYNDDDSRYNWVQFNNVKFYNYKNSAGLSLENSNISLTNSMFYKNNVDYGLSLVETPATLKHLTFEDSEGVYAYGESFGTTVSLWNSIVNSTNGTFDYNNFSGVPFYLDEFGHLDPQLSEAIDYGNSSLGEDACMGPGLGTSLPDAGMYGGFENCGYGIDSNIPDGAPIITNIGDIPQDQGGFVGIQYDASIFDYSHPAHEMSHYTFWRELDLEGRESLEFSQNPDANYWNRDREYWEYIGDMSALNFEQYGYVAPTIADSNQDGEFSSTFIVVAHTTDEDIYFTSDPASGQSIDNLAPVTPMMLSGDFESGEISLVWSNFVDQDFSYFNLYRNEELYSTVLDSQYVDFEVPNIPELFYSVSAVDHNGNESSVSQEIMVQAHLMGDLNDDFQLNILDVVGLMEYILGFYEIEDLTYADLNEDSNVDILDVISLVTIILDENGM